jgi:hypothetical protein
MEIGRWQFDANTSEKKNNKTLSQRISHIYNPSYVGSIGRGSWSKGSLNKNHKTLFKK